MIVEGLWGDMMYCTNCGHRFGHPTDRYCGHCGSAIQAGTQAAQSGPVAPQDHAPNPNVDPHDQSPQQDPPGASPAMSGPSPEEGRALRRWTAGVLGVAGAAVLFLAAVRVPGMLSDIGADTSSVDSSGGTRTVSTQIACFDAAAFSLTAQTLLFVDPSNFEGIETQARILMEGRSPDPQVNSAIRALGTSVIKALGVIRDVAADPASNTGLPGSDLMALEPAIEAMKPVQAATEEVLAACD